MGAHTPALREIAYAKINLALHVRERMADGYHRIETLFAFCEGGDVLHAEPADDLILAIEGPFGAGLSAGPENLVMRAAEALRYTANVDAGAAIRLTKALPIASGIGGGSADAAAALRVLRALWNLEIDDAALHRIALDLGADVPACLLSQTCHGGGRGDTLRPVAATEFTGRPMLLVNPAVAIETGLIFAAWDGVDRGPLHYADPLQVDPAWRNDLEVPALAAAPEIGDLLTELSAMPGAHFVRMSGSGATCFTLFDTDEDRDAAAVAMASARPEWWLMSTRLR